MEIIIIVCLLIIIVLLLQDRIVIQWKSKEKPMERQINPKLPNIMGRPKPVRSQSVPNSAIESQTKKTEIHPDNLDIEYDENEIVGIQIPQEELDEVFSNSLNLAEEDLNKLRASDGDDSFAQGVTFEELNNVGTLLQNEIIEPTQKETTIAIVQRLQGTELLALLESSMEDASRKIAELLNSSLTNEIKTSYSTLRNDDLSDFDIGEFV